MPVEVVVADEQFTANYVWYVGPNHPAELIKYSIRSQIGQGGT